MKKFLLPLLLCTVISGVSAKTLVATPDKALKQSTEPLKFMDRDFWYMLRPQWHTLPGVKDEAFVRDAGTWNIYWSLNTKNGHPMRVLWLRELKIYQSVNSIPRAVSLKVNIIPAEKSAEVCNVAHLDDNDYKTVCAVSGNIGDLHTRYTPITATLKCEFQRSAPLTKLILAYGTDKNPGIGKVRFFSEGKELKPANVTMSSGILTALFKNSEPVKILDIVCDSNTLQLVADEFKEMGIDEKRLLNYPFTSHMMRPVPFGLSQNNFDRDSVKKYLNKYRKSHVGITFAEWDSQAFFQSIKPNSRLYAETVAAFGEPTNNRQEMAKMMGRFWNWHKSIFFDHIWGMSGSTALAHYGMEWGGTVSGLEITNHTSTIAHRTLMRYTAGAGRQYGKPWLLYLAYYLGKFSPNSTRPVAPKNSKLWIGSPDGGISPSFSRRVFLSGYFMGTTFLSFEAQPWGQAEQTKNGTVKLNANGKVLKEFYEWTRTPAGKRGIWYTPILLVSDFHHGHIRRSGSVWGWGESDVPMTKGDWMSENFNRAIDYYDGQAAAWDKPPYSHNMHNSSLGDIFDSAIGNPPSGQRPCFDNYPVVILTDDIAIDNKLRQELQNYVISGGTLVVNSIHLKSLGAAMNRIKFTGKKISEEGMTIPQIRLGSCKPVIRSDAKTPLVVKYKYGFGNVLVTLPEYFLGENKEQPSKYLVQLLEKLQKEVLPFAISGDAQFIISRMGKDRWKVALINNKGVLKNPWDRTEKFDPAYTTKVKITLPPGATMREIYHNEKISSSTITLPPGAVRVLEITNATLPQHNDLKLLASWPLDGTPGVTTIGKSQERHFDVKYAETASGKKVYDASNPQTLIQIFYSPGFPLNAATFEFWAKPDLNYNFSDRGGYPLAGRFYWVSVRNKHWNFIVLDKYTMPGPPAKHNRWDHLAFSWDGQNCRFYVNGKEYSESGVPIKIMYPLWDGSFDIASRGRGRRTFGGCISAVKLYGKAMNANEIKMLYEQNKKTYQE